MKANANVSNANTRREFILCVSIAAIAFAKSRRCQCQDIRAFLSLFGSNRRLPLPISIPPIGPRSVLRLADSEDQPEPPMVERSRAHRFHSAYAEEERAARQEEGVCTLLSLEPCWAPTTRPVTGLRKVRSSAN